MLLIIQLILGNSFPGQSKNFAGYCNKLIELQAGGTYNFTVAVFGVEREQVRAWIDYNNDGLFNNATEQIIFTSSELTIRRPTLYPIH
jgi:hypothetical protein